MSFETWAKKYRLDHDYGHGLIEASALAAWKASRAESEAEIAALKSERDALKKELFDLHFGFTSSSI